MSPTDWTTRRNFTTGQIAEIAQVATRTVAKWFDSGELRGHRLNGSHGDRRVSRENLIPFLKDRGFSTEALEGKARLILFDFHGEELAGLASILESIGATTCSVHSEVTLGMELRPTPGGICINTDSIGVLASQRLLEQLAEIPGMANCFTVLMGRGEDLDQIESNGPSVERFRRPLDLNLICVRVASRIR